MKRLHLSIRQIAAPKYLSQAEIARRTHISRNTINGLWTGETLRNAHFETLETLAAVLECSPLDFFSVTDEPD